MKRIFAAVLFAAAVSFLFSNPVAAQSTRTFSLIQGSTIGPASPGIDQSGAVTYYGGLVVGQVVGTNPSTFTLSIAFRNTGVVDQVAGIYSGEILPPYNTFAVTESTGRNKSVTTSGTIETGTVTYRLLADGRADIISVVSNSLIVWEGKNKRRTAVGHGSLNYGTSTEGVGTIELYF